MADALDFIDDPLSCLTGNDPVLVLDVAELTESGEIKLKIIDYFMEHLSDEKQPYLTSYALYMKSLCFSGTEKEKILRDAAGFFIKATLKKKDKVYAQAYLAHAYYDLEEYAAALEHIGKIPKNYFSRKRQKWRDILMRQLKICCFIRLNNLDNIENHLYDYFVSLTYAKESDIPISTELTETIKSLIK